MKKVLAIIIIAVHASLFPLHAVFAQHELWGMTQYGGDANSGVIYKTDLNGQNLQAVYSFTQFIGKKCYGHPVKANNGKLYGMTEEGGFFGLGVLFEYTPSTGKYRVIVEFDNERGESPQGSLMLASNGKLYGCTREGGTNNQGVLFEYNTSTDSYIVHHNFLDFLDGNGPTGQLLQSTNGKLYGTAILGGTNNYGTLFEFDPLTNSFSKKFDFDGFDKGSVPNGKLVEAVDGKIYGMTQAGGAFDAGLIYSYDPASNQIHDYINFNTVNTGHYPLGGLMLAPDNTLYGMCLEGGTFHSGLIFQFDPVTTNYTIKANFNETVNGKSPYGSLIDGQDGGFYGLTYFGGINGTGTLFKYNPSDNEITKLIDFYGDDYGENPVNDLYLSGNGLMYGNTLMGGFADGGVLFEFDPASSVFTKIFDFNASSAGAKPWGGLTPYADDQLFGVAPMGGIIGGGVIFEVNPSDGNYTVRYNLDWYTEGGFPLGSLLKASNAKLYGTTNAGGANHNGTIYEFDPAGNIFSKLFDFDGTATGSYPYGSLIEATDGKLYGTAHSDGYNNRGTLFSFDPSSSIFTNLFDFVGSSGVSPSGGLVQAVNGKLYGMTNQGGSFNKGVLFEYDPVTSTYVVKTHFDGTNKGKSPEGGLIEVEGLLYGLTLSGGVNDDGVLFSYDPVLGLFSKKVDFNQDIHGAHPVGNLCQASNDKLFGLTTWGGSYTCGTVFSYDISTNILTKTVDFSGADGKYPRMAFLVEVVNSSGIPDKEDRFSDLSVSPNPASDHLRIRYRMPDAGYRMIGIYDISGRKIMEFTGEEKSPGQYEIDIDVSDFPPGIYICKMQGDKKVLSRKFIVLSE